MVRVAIISAGYKKEEMSQKFLSHLEESLKKCKAYTEIYFVWALDVIPDEIKWADIGIFHSVFIKNKSFSNSMNTGLKKAMDKKYDYYLIIGNDGFPQTEGWLDMLIESQVKHGSWITCPEHDKPPITAYSQHHLFDEGQVSYYKMFPAVCWLLPDTVVEEIGLFDEQFEVGCYEDDDYAKRVIDAGGHIIVDRRVKLKHLLSQTFGQFDASHVMGVNQQKFKAKYKL